MSELKQNYLLAIESAVLGGSVAVFHGGDMVDCWAGSGRTSRAEDLLAAIDQICTRAVGRVENLSKIAISVGPGSFTGLRIGISTALGLARGLGVDCVGVPILEAMALSRPAVAPSIVAIPLGKADICYQQFGSEGNPTSDVKAVSKDAFIELLTQHENSSILVPQALSLLANRDVVDVGDCLARHIGYFALSRPAERARSPIYAQNPRLG